MNNLRSNVSKGVVVASLPPLWQETANSAHSARYPEVVWSNKSKMVPTCLKDLPADFWQVYLPYQYTSYQFRQTESSFSCRWLDNKYHSYLLLQPHTMTKAPHMLTAKMQIYRFLGYMPTQSCCLLMAD